MWFVRLPKPIDNAEMVLPELVGDWVDTQIVQSINNIVLQQLQVDMLLSWVTKLSKGGLPHRHTFRIVADWAGGLWLEQPWLVPENPWPRRPKEGNIVAWIHLQYPISSQGQWCQDAWVWTALCQPQNVMPRQWLWHLSVDNGSGRGDSSRALKVSGGYLFEY